MGRPKKALETMKLWQARAADPEMVEYLFVFNDNDGSRYELEPDPATTLFEVVKVDAVVRYSAPAWNCGALAARGNLLIQGQDDVEPPQNWDHELLKLIHEHGGMNEPIFIGVGDGYRKDVAAQLRCTAIMTRAYRDQEGFFLFHGYRSVFSDDEVTYRALRNEADGLAKYVRADNLVFVHRHHYHDKTVPWDDTYAHENAPEAYAQGKRLFESRNPRALTDGLKKW